ncbi:aminoglycoside phosphotransferase family protein [Epibacterium ulvae]|nr:aminoglycoside phosphotransferase family protein [Epibacterium ulvae]
MTRRDGGSAILKLYHNGMGNEAAGFDYLDQFGGQNAVTFFDIRDELVLMEDLPGPSLGDFARAGHDAEAAVELANLARDLQSHAKVTPDLLPISRAFQPMFQQSFDDLLTSAQRAIYREGVAVAQDCLGNQSCLRPLHGDLHHDNVLNTPRGYCAFDAKGMIGDPAYELANAFRHPRGRPEWTTDVIRAQRVAVIWAEALHVTPSYLLSWAMAKVTLSIFWQLRRGQVSAVEFDHFETFAKARAFF